MVPTVPGVAAGYPFGSLDVFADHSKKQEMSTSHQPDTVQISYCTGKDDKK